LSSASTTADVVRDQVARIFSQIFPWGTWWSAASLLLLWVMHLLIHPLSSSTLCCTITSLTPLFCCFRRDSCAWPCASGFCEYSSSPPAYESPKRHRHQAYAAFLSLSLCAGLLCWPLRRCTSGSRPHSAKRNETGGRGGAKRQGGRGGTVGALSGT
jgi:hypothetical protein